MARTTRTRKPARRRPQAPPSPTPDPETTAAAVRDRTAAAVKPADRVLARIDALLTSKG